MERNEALRKLLYIQYCFNIKGLYIKGILSLMQAAFAANVVNCAGILASQLPRAFLRAWDNGLCPFAGPHNSCFAFLPQFHESNHSMHVLPEGSSGGS